MSVNAKRIVVKSFLVVTVVAIVCAAMTQQAIAGFDSLVDLLAGGL